MPRGSGHTAAFCIALIVLLSLVGRGTEQHLDAQVSSGRTESGPTPQPGAPPFELLDLPTGGAAPQAPVAHPSLPDLDVAFIGRTPAYGWDQPKKWPDPGEAVTFHGHIANRGSLPVASFNYLWTIDGAAQPLGTHPGLDPGTEDVVTFSWSWQTGIHTVELTLDPSGTVGEISETNNSVEDRTNALALGIYVEQSFYDFFNENVWDAGWGGDSFDDWMQRHVAIWNDMFAAAIHPLTPGGVIDRVRLDKVVRVPDGGLNCSVNFPADDKTIDLIWGFISEMVGVPSVPGCPGWTPRYRDDPSSWDRDLGLLHEWSHARYLIDLYGMNIDSHEKTLVVAVGPQDSTLTLSDIPAIPEFSPPANLILNGELIVCNSRSGNTFTDCGRGQEGTYARAHPAGSTVFGDQIHLQDGRGNALAGGPGLPATNGAFFHDRYFTEDLMNAGSQYGEHSAMAWNRIAGQRPVCGNANAPCNIGEYLNDIPADNIVELRWPDGQVIPGARVELFQAKPYPIWYGKTFAKTPDLVRFTDAAGRASLGPFPFGDQPPIQHTYGHSNAVLLLKLKAQDKVGAQFLEVTDFNLAFWAGHTAEAIYPITFTHYVTVPNLPTWAVFLPLAVRGEQAPASHWEKQASGTTRYLNDLFFVDDSRGWVVGQAGIILNTSDGGTTWSQQASSVGNDLEGVHCISALQCWAVGDGGTILKTADGGGYWAKLTSGTTMDLDNVQFVNGNTGWAVGRNGTILKTLDGGAHWTPQTSGTTFWLWGLHFLDENTGWASGGTGTGVILHTDDGGAHWTAVDTNNEIADLFFVDASTGWAVTNAACKILRTTNGGASWTAYSPPITVGWLTSVYFVNGDEGWVTGASGSIFHTTDGGTSWSVQASPVSGTLQSVYFPSTAHGWIAGESGTILFYDE